MTADYRDLFKSVEDAAREYEETMQLGFFLELADKDTEEVIAAWDAYASATGGTPDFWGTVRWAVKARAHGERWRP